MCEHHKGCAGGRSPARGTATGRGRLLPCPVPDAMCPCGLPHPYARCCGRFHRGEQAPTAELLMRSRYTAFAVGDAEYLLRSWHPDTRPRRLQVDPADEWTRLEILGRTGGGLLEAAGTVEFRAHHLHRGRRDVLHENSSFRREDGSWLYVEPV